MTEGTNPNTTEVFSISSEQLDALFASSAENLAANNAARQRAEEWPNVIERLLVKVARRSDVQDELLTAIDARLLALEAAMGIPKS